MTLQLTTAHSLNIPSLIWLGTVVRSVQLLERVDDAAEGTKVVGVEIRRAGLMGVMGIVDKTSFKEGVHVKQEKMFLLIDTY